MRNAPVTVTRRTREKVRGRVMPSPVGLAIENERSRQQSSIRGSSADLSAAEVVKESLQIAAGIDVYTNDNIIVDELPCKN